MVNIPLINRLYMSGGDRRISEPSTVSGQIIATSHDRFPPNGGLVREIPRKFQGNLGRGEIL